MRSDYPKVVKAERVNNMAGQKKHPIGTGDEGHTGGHGRAQGGQGNWGGGVAASNRPAVFPGKGYQTSAHSDTYHHHGEAVGHLTDVKPMHYSTTLHGEGNSEIHTDGVYGKAAHHGSMGEAHKFANSKSGHGFGHSVSNMKGPLRMSGHPKAHRLGCK